ncbi:hypothetical protein GUJ93_ZPchr0006g42637 [Zizania palustris]|uniref:DUF7597 domain-containing protein n=1 Tax=Zizania palustris TaxID=103762 RepID=A0A8J5SZU3_ZIZPA|nr:hypothetical protein GUJ93_ZPchr0006g42637 [Zizania palustris]
MDPLIYIPRGGTLIDRGGPHRKKRSVVSICGQHVKKNEEMAIAICEDNFTAWERHEFLMLIHHHLTQEMRRTFRLMAATHTPLMEKYFQVNQLGFSSGWTINCFRCLFTPPPFMSMRLRMNIYSVSQWLKKDSGTNGLSLQSTTCLRCPKLRRSSALRFRSVQNAMQEIVPIPLPPASPPRPPIRFFYSRRNRKAEDEIKKGKSVISPASAIASTSNAGKGKETLPLRPTLQDFMNVSIDNGKQYSELSFGQINFAATHYCGLTAKQVTVANLMTDDATNNMLLTVRASPTGDASNALN